MPPELIRAREEHEKGKNKFKGVNGEKADMFALGVSLFLLVAGRPPFSKAHPKDKLYRFIF